jgi:hypothetical protein
VNDAATPRPDPADNDRDNQDPDGPEEEEVTGAYELAIEVEQGDEAEDALDIGDGDDEESDVGDFDETVGDGEVAYDCTTWAGESRALLANLLDTNGIVHAWQGTVVSVREEDEAAVDLLIEDVLASARPALDPAAPKVVYEVGRWPAGLQTSLADALTVADLPYEWDERGDLVVYEEHEDEVEAILDQLPDPDDPDLDAGELSSDDGLAVHDRLDRLFDGASRLAKHPDEAAAVIAVDEVASDLERMAPPFGFEPGQWRLLVGKAVALRDALAADPGTDDALDDDGLSALAAETRDLLRQYV